MIKVFMYLLAAGIFSSVFAQNDNSATAKAFIDSFGRQEFAKAYEFFGDEVKSQFPVTVMPQILSQITGNFGAFQQAVRTEKIGSSDNLTLFVEFEKATVAMTVLFDSTGKIRSFTLDQSKTVRKNQARYETPSYADQNSFEESEVTVGTGEWALPATLTMPKGKVNVPAIVLVHGSGPNDRDETHLNPANKIFKDIAWGLASKGIAVLRYDKRTFVHGQKLGSVKKFTINEETVDDAVLAVDLLGRAPNIDVRNIYVLGHSLGGMAIPRIGAKGKNIAGLVIFAGTSRKLDDVYVEQNYYLASLAGAPSKELQVELGKLKELARKTKALKISDPENTPTLLSLPVSYWVDLNSYDPPALAKTLKQPMLILQGESDYQVTMADFMLWKNALGKRKNVTFKTYPKLTHAFMSGAGGTPGPQNYEKPNHVDEVVISDIRNWILKTSKK